MERFKRLNTFRKGLLLFMAALLLVFAVLYIHTLRRVGFAYQDVIFVPTEENGATVYSGKIKGQQASFAVSAEGNVTYRCGGETYGPYTVREDPGAVPQDTDLKMTTGVEIRRGEEVVFRGGVWKGDFYLFCRTDGTLLPGGTRLDETDPASPTLRAILQLIDGPELTHRGYAPAWWVGAFLCLLNALSILFAEELFRHRAAWLVRDVDRAEPSDWELTSRAIRHTLVAFLALCAFVVGLQ